MHTDEGHIIFNGIYHCGVGYSNIKAAIIVLYRQHVFEIINPAAT